MLSERGRERRFLRLKIKKEKRKNGTRLAVVWTCLYVCVFISRVESAAARSARARLSLDHPAHMCARAQSHGYACVSCVDPALDIVDSRRPAKPAPGRRRSIIKRAGFAIASIRIGQQIISRTRIYDP